MRSRSCMPGGSSRSARRQVLLARPRHPYTQALLESMPSPRTPRQARLKAIPASRRRSGSCRRAARSIPRCRYAQDVCRSTGAGPGGGRGSQEVACWVAQQAPAAGAGRRRARAGGRRVTAQRPTAARGDCPPDAEEHPGARSESPATTCCPAAGPSCRRSEVHALDDVIAVGPPRRDAGRCRRIRQRQVDPGAVASSA